MPHPVASAATYEGRDRGVNPIAVVTEYDWHSKSCERPVTSESHVDPEALVNIIIVFGHNNDRNVQRFVNGRFGDRLWAYLCIPSNLFGPKTS